MSSAALALQGAANARLKADAGVNSIVAGRVLDRVSPDTPFPYISQGEDQGQTARADGYEGMDVTLTFHAWSRGVGFPELKRLTAAMVKALASPLVVEGHRVVEAFVIEVRHLRDPDGSTSHGVVTYRALTEPAD